MEDLRTLLRSSGLTPRALSGLVPIAEPHVHCILSRTRRASAATAIRFEEVTGGAIKRGDLRPDLWPDQVTPPGKAAA